MYNPLSSITDLRSKGESRRFTDEVGYLLEGLDPIADLSVRRSSALDIVTKLCDPAFWRKSRAAGLLSRIWELMRGAGAGDGDKVCLHSTHGRIRVCLEPFRFWTSFYAASSRWHQRTCVTSPLWRPIATSLKPSSACS